MLCLFLATGCSQNDPFEKGAKLSQTIQANEKYSVGDSSKTGWVLNVPTGAFDGKAELEMNVLSIENSKKIGVPEGNVLGNVVEITAKANDASVVYLNKPVTLYFKIPASQFSKNDEYKYMAACHVDGEWIYAYPKTVDYNTGTVTFDTDHFTSFALVSMKEQALIKKYAADMVRREWEKGNSKTQILSRLDTAFRDAMSAAGIVEAKDQSLVLLKIKKLPKFDKMITDIEYGENVDISKICTELTTDGIFSKYANLPAVEMIPFIGPGKSLRQGFVELDRGNYSEAIAEFGKSIAKSFPTTAIMNSVRETIQLGGIAARDWERFSTNVGYKAYLKYASSTAGKYEVNAPEWNKVMISLYGSTDKARYQSLKEYAEKNKTSIADLQKDKARSEKIYKEFCDGINDKYSERYILEKNLSKLQTDYEKIAQGFIKEGFLNRGTMGYASDMSLKARLESLFEARAYILDLFGGKMPTLSLGESNEANLNQAIAEYILCRGDTAKFFKWLKEKGYIKRETSTIASPTSAPGASSNPTVNPQPSQAPAQNQDNGFAWVLVETKNNDWKAAMDSQNKATAGTTKLSIAASGGSATFTKTYIGKDGGQYGDSWLKNGMTESGKITWSAPSLKTIKPNEKFSINLTCQHLNSTYKYPSGGWTVLAQVFRLDSKGDQAGSAAYLTDKDGKSSYVSGAGNNFQSFSSTVVGTISSGSRVGDRMSIRVSATGVISVQTWYVYEWRAG